MFPDSDEDWETEASTMHLVYSNSVCTVSASNSASPEESLFRSRNLDLMVPGRVEGTLVSKGLRSYYIFDHRYWDRQISSPLHKIGWAFQERISAPRVLYFGKNQLMWECLSTHRCEIFPNDIPWHHSDKAIDELLEISPTDNGTKSKSLSSYISVLWTNLITNYSSCDLTYSSDRLPAVAGIAKRFKQITNDRYLAGIWSSHKLEMMGWPVFLPKAQQPFEYNAPS
jgi:hypothetical protein